MKRELADEVERYLETGEYDLLFSAWPGHDRVEKGRRGKRALLDALIAEVRGRSGGAAPPPVPGGLDVAAFARSRVEPMVRGLFARRETFAWCCETYSRIVALGWSPAARAALLAEVERGRMPCSDEVDGAEYVDILREAVAARNGWKRILGRCTEARTTRPAARDGAPAGRQARP